MQGAAPMHDDDDVRMDRIRVRLAEMRAAREAEKEQLEEAIEAVLPGAVALVQQAVLEPEGDHLSVVQRLRNKVPGWLGKAAKEAVVLTMIGAITALVKMYTSPDPTPPADLMAPPDFAGFLAQPKGTSVVDEVFTKAKRASPRGASRQSRVVLAGR